MFTKAERTRLFIIEKSAPIFNTKGYAATSMSDILAATGLAKGGIYGNFKNKDEIALEAFDYSFNKMREALRFIIKQQETSAGKLNAILDFYQDYSIKPLITGGCPLLNTAIDVDDSLPLIKEHAAKGLREMLATLKQIIEQGIKYGEFSKKLDATGEAELFFATIEGGLMMSKLNDSPAILNRLLENMKQQIKQRYTK
ncbi:MAG TPA: TetR/AcrR family transcriptional regulator [Bacteroidia bacterium]|nr:TetR/AcrR family transcriptional regulator [Bacteroidia bacterium]